MSAKTEFLRKPLLLVAAVIICLAMLRLGVWQLDRAAQKQDILDQSVARAALVPVPLDQLLAENPAANPASLRFRQVSVSGSFLPEHSILIDNQVVDSRVGYQVMSPFRSHSGHTVVVNRGWIPVGDSRDILPPYTAPTGTYELQGRLVTPFAKPPLWDEQYPVFRGPVWQYLPLPLFAEQSELTVLPLVLELAPESAPADALLRKWPTIDDKWVATHHGYALQWFTMAAVFFIACLILLIKSIKSAPRTGTANDSSTR